MFGHGPYPNLLVERINNQKERDNGEGTIGLEEFLWVSDTHIEEQPFLASCNYISRVANERGNFMGT